MADNPFPLSQAAVVTSHPKSAGIRQMIQEENPITDFMTFVPVPQGSAQRRWFEESGLPTTAFRGLYGSYDASYGRIVPKSDPVAILGGEFQVDRAIPNLYANDLPDFINRQLAMLARSAYREFEEAVFEGDTGVDANAFDGYRVRAAERGMEFDATGSGTDRAELELSMLDEVFDAVPGSKVVHGNQWLRRKINALVRAAGQAREMVGGEFGRQYDSYAGVPYVIQERSNDMTTILDFDEDPGDGGDDAASLYVAHYGGPDEENAVMGILGAGGAWDAYSLGEDQTDPKNLWRLEVYPGISVQGNRALARLKGLGQI